MAGTAAAAFAATGIAVSEPTTSASEEAIAETSFEIFIEILLFTRRLQKAHLYRVSNRYFHSPGGAGVSPYFTPDLFVFVIKK
jgi:hypothetical protein